MRSPILAILWENWRLTRLEVAARLAVGVLGASAVLVVFAAAAPDHQGIQDFGAAVALVVVVFPHFLGWLSIFGLNGDRPGFPFSLLYTRPVRTAVLVGVPMVYLTAAAAATYLVSALLLRVTSGYPFPLLPVAAWIAALTLVQLATTWSTRTRAAQLLILIAAGNAWLLLAMRRLNAEKIPGSFDWPPHVWPARFDFPLTDYAAIGAIGLAALGVAVARVARQRHGDGSAAPVRTPGGGFPLWLVSLFRFPCPTSSATRAQVWFELKSSGFPVLAIGAALALANPLVSAVSGPIDALLGGGFYARPMAMFLALFSVLAVLSLGGNAFGIRARQGRIYAGAFEATRAYDTARLAALKVLVKSICVLAALCAVAGSVWVSLSFLAVGAGDDPLSRVPRAIEHAFNGVTLTDYQLAVLAVLLSIGLAVLAVVGSIGVVAMVAMRAAFGALRARYPRRLTIAGLLLLVHALALVALVPARQRGSGFGILADALFRATPWLAAAALVLATIYLLWRVLAERLLTPGQACGVVLVSAVLGAAWLPVLGGIGAQLFVPSSMDAAWMLSAALLPLAACLLVPWSLSRVRHT
jgi:hypothetical protein